MASGSMRVVIVDDSAEDRLDIKAALLRGSTRSYEFYEAETGDEGVRVIRRLVEAGSRPDCVVFDVHLPGTDLLDCLAELPREDGQVAVPVVVITGDERFDRGRALLAAGAQDFVGKGWLTPDSLTRAVNSAVERRALTVELRRREEEARRLELKLQQAQKLESVGMLAGGIAHDFNNLLVGVLGNAALALSEIPQGAPGRAEVEAIQAAAVRASELTHQLLAYAGRGRFTVEHTDLGRLVEEMGYLLSSAIPKHVAIRYHLAPGLPPVHGDPTQLRQVLMNLITNAADAIGADGGDVTVTTGLLRAAGADLSDTPHGEDLPAGDYVYCEVQDTGCGMSAETKAKIFDPFFTTKFTGRGLGLAAVLGILRAHRGAIKVESEPGRGSKLTVLLPAAPAAPTAPAAPAAPTAPATPAPRSAAPQDTGTILIVDDEQTIRSVTRLILERAGFQVLLAEGGAEALEIFRERRAEIRAVLLDLTMPQMSGNEVLRRIREIQKDVAVLLASGFTEQEVTRELAEDPLVDFIPKPFKPKDLLEHLRGLLGRG